MTLVADWQATSNLQDRKDVIRCLFTVCEAIGCSCHRGIFEHIGFGLSDTSISLTPYPDTAFPYFDKLESGGEDNVRQADFV